MSDTQAREAFEDCYRRNSGRLKIARSEKGYGDPIVDMSWLIWLAAWNTRTTTGAGERADAAYRNRALEDAAIQCEKLELRLDNERGRAIARLCVKRIRALIDAERASGGAG